jgi:hypothetical protein
MIALVYLIGLGIGLALGWTARSAKAQRDSDWAFHLAEKRANWQYHQGAIEAMNALEPKRDAQGRYVAKERRAE